VIRIQERSGGTPPALSAVIAYQQDPIWSSDGAGQSLFEDTRDGKTDICSIATVGTTEILLTRESGLDESPSWSPDGRHIPFQSGRDAGGSRGGNHIFTMDADGSNVKRVH
jgi:TolB protein